MSIDCLVMWVVLICVCFVCFYFDFLGSFSVSVLLVDWLVNDVFGLLLWLVLVCFLLCVSVLFWFYCVLVYDSC